MEVNDMDNGPFYSETQKIRPRVEKYFEGKKFILDYGCGSTLITPEAKGIDLVYKDKVTAFVLKDLEQVYDFGHEQGWQNKVDGIFSSHFLEHIEYDTLMLRNWIDLLKTNGVLALYLPDDDHYDNSANPEHLQKYKYDSFVNDFNRRFSDRMKLMNHGPDVGHDRYSFFIVAKRL
jgi:predicted SAM-dependent methyltransferase